MDGFKNTVLRLLILLLVVNSSGVSALAAATHDCCPESTLDADSAHGPSSGGSESAGISVFASGEGAHGAPDSPTPIAQASRIASHHSDALPSSGSSGAMPNHDTHVSTEPSATWGAHTEKSLSEPVGSSHDCDDCDRVPCSVGSCAATHGQAASLVADPMTPQGLHTAALRINQASPEPPHGLSEPPYKPPQY